MKSISIAGRIGKDAEVRSTQKGDQVTGFPVAVDDGWGDNKRTLWFDCSMWGQRGAKMASYLLKGVPVAVTGDLGTREHNGKTYLTVRVSDMTFQGSGKREDAGRQASQASPAPSGGGMMDDDIPFMWEGR